MTAPARSQARRRGSQDNRPLWSQAVESATDVVGVRDGIPFCNRDARMANRGHVGGERGIGYVERGDDADKRP